MGHQVKNMMKRSGSSRSLCSTIVTELMHTSDTNSATTSHMYRRSENGIRTAVLAVIPGSARRPSKN